MPYMCVLARQHYFHLFIYACSDRFYGLSIFFAQEMQYICSLHICVDKFSAYFTNNNMRTKCDQFIYYISSISIQTYMYVCTHTYGEQLIIIYY